LTGSLGTQLGEMLINLLDLLLDRLRAGGLSQLLEGAAGLKEGLLGLFVELGIDQAQAAEVLGVSVPTSKRRWAAARMRVGALLARE